MGQTAEVRRGGRAFDRVAAAYDANRPAYPDELVDRAFELAGLGHGDRVLELGCGTGQLTRSLIARGVRVTVVEPGEHLIALAGRNLEGGGEVELVNARFEDADFPDGRFGAVFSAAAFHWIDPDVSWRKAAAALAPGGTLALIQYCGLHEPSIDCDHEQLLSALSRIAPEIAAGWPVYRDLAGTEAGARARAANVSEVWAWVGTHEVGRADAAELFDDARIATVPVLAEHTADELNALLGTASFHSRFTPEQRRAIELEHETMFEQLGRPIRSSMAAVLVTARLRGESAG